MSKEVSSSLPLHFSSKPADRPTNNASSSSTISYAKPSGSGAATSTWQAPSHWGIGTPTPTVKRKPTKVKQRTQEELDITARTAAKVKARLAADHAAVLNPTVDTPFSDIDDVVARLLPYHVFQQPKEDLEYLTDTGKGKRKAAATDLETEVKETRFALECHKRRQALQERFRKARTRSGKRLAPDDQAVVLAQAVLEADRGETALLNSELRAARQELDKIEREKRLAANPQRSNHYVAQTTPVQSSGQHAYYRGYPYAYAQPYGAPPQSSSMSTFSVNPATPSTTANQYQPAQTGSAIPVQLPVASLPALHALGIVPVPATSVTGDGQQQPAPPAVLRGSSANGTMLSLEINVSLLQSAQMSGLALMLNSLMSRTSGTTSTAPPAPPTTNGASGSTSGT